MSRPNMLLVIESSDVGVAYTAHAARSLGLTPYFAVDLQHYAGDPRRQLAAEQVIDVDTNQADSIIAAVTRTGVTPAAVVTMLDSRLVVALDVAAHFGVPGHDPAIRPLKDKAVVAELVPEASPRSFSIRLGDPDLERTCREFVGEVGACIAKPVLAAGAVGVTLLDGPDAIRRFVAEARTVKLAGAIASDVWILQQRIEGPLVSCEGFVVDAAVTFLGVTGRGKIGATETRMMYPFDADVGRAHVEQMHDTIRALLARSGMRSGYFHIEFLLAERPYLIDANTGRPGGGPIAELLAMAHGLSPIELFRHVLDTTLFGNTLGSRAPGPQAAGSWLGICYGAAEACDVIGVRLAPTSVNHTLIVDDGRSVPAMGTNNWAWIGMLSGERQATLDCFSTLQIATNNGAVTPAA